MRDRCWRRFTQELKVKKRLKLKSQNHSWRFYAPNGHILYYPSWTDLIGSDYAHSFKEQNQSYSRYNHYRRYSANKSLYYREVKPNRDSLGTREADRREFLKILKEHGLK